MTDPKDEHKKRHDDRSEEESGESQHRNNQHEPEDSTQPVNDTPESDEKSEVPSSKKEETESEQAPEPQEDKPVETSPDSVAQQDQPEGTARKPKAASPDEEQEQPEKHKETPIETSPDSVEQQDQSEGYVPEDELEPESEEYYDGYSQEYGYTPSDPETVDASDSSGEPPTSDDDEEVEEPEEGGNGRKKKKSYDEKKMPFLEHLEELRWTLLRSFAAIFVAAVVCFIFHKQIVDFLRWPAPDDLKLIYLSPTEGFMIYIKVALFSGLVVALPYVSYEFWKFIVPGLLDKERKLVPPIVFFTVFCFALGGAFAYMIIIPFAMKFLLGFQTEYLEATLAIGKYLGFVVTLILVFGVVFELPVLSFFLSKVGLLTPDFLRSKRRYGIVTIFILAAFLTPPDITTQLFLAGPLIILYEISIWVSAAVVRKKAAEEEEED